MIEYTGYIKKIRFYSESSNYIVALIEVEQEDKLITMNGYMKKLLNIYLVRYLRGLVKLWQHK